MRILIKLHSIVCNLALLLSNYTMCMCKPECKPEYMVTRPPCWCALTECFFNPVRFFIELISCRNPWGDQLEVEVEELDFHLGSRNQIDMSVKVKTYTLDYSFRVTVQVHLQFILCSCSCIWSCEDTFLITCTNCSFSSSIQERQRIYFSKLISVAM